MKLTHLIAQYLYKNKRLDLQGIGSFLLDNSIIIDEDSNKKNQEIGIEGVSFESNAATKEDPELVSFISSYTGKIKALASADLNSHLELAKQFMNIGKPFLFEGIGSLTRIRSGEYSFTPGSALTEKLSEQKIKETKQNSSTEEPVSDYKSALYKQEKKSNWKKPVTFILVIAGIALAIWGGYTVYKRTSADNSNKTEVAKENKTILLEDSLSTNPDSITALPVKNISNQTGTTKFVLEVSDKDRATQRYAKLKTFQWDVKMETKDSVSFKLFLLLPINAVDSIKVLDSLTRLNGKQVFIER
ncbi:MAG TPA: hypothetical protein PLX17_12045 [Chitinophagaceae bacterium]|nr:hypothetical protein [Chitinophagaceae bacterium]MBP7108230.1 hypothetical protein [Chitinophagaceae bacterium]MBP7314083.1 hypothetical protein [Chitinophagaceae bacterium]HQV56245.1 hypothetical protein [Chitinophagaceae bacterium]HQZ50460.1 hypothetical protein [Chitinophagaceae bacterium]